MFMYCFIYFLCILGLLHVYCCVLSASNKSRDDDDDDGEMYVFPDGLESSSKDVWSGKVTAEQLDHIVG